MKLNKINTDMVRSQSVRIQLLALDVDGTLFNEEGKITPASIAAIKKAQQAGITVVIASGRDYETIPWDQLEGIEIPYAITLNGSSMFRTSDEECLYEEFIPTEQALAIVTHLLPQKMYMEAFIDGKSYAPAELAAYVHELTLPKHIIDMIVGKQLVMKDMPERIRQGAKVQKGTLNFIELSDGTFLHREETRRFLKSMGCLSIVNGGYHNLEFTRAGVDKSVGLHKVAELLDIPMEAVAAIGDSDNDIRMLEDAGLGIAMGNALDRVKCKADAVTLSNEEDGVAFAIEKILSVQNVV